MKINDLAVGDLVDYAGAIHHRGGRVEEIRGGRVLVRWSCDGLYATKLWHDPAPLRHTDPISALGRLVQKRK
jgi:hypothetical protein